MGTRKGAAGMAGVVYLIGSLRNPNVPVVAQSIRKLGLEVFDDWYAAGPEADDYWRAYEEARGRTYEEALSGYAANHVFNYDRSHIQRADIAVLLLPAGRSGHLEFGFAVGQGKHGIICKEPESDRWDVMYRFANKVVTGDAALLEYLSTFKFERV